MRALLDQARGLIMRFLILLVVIQQPAHSGSDLFARSHIKVHLDSNHEWKKIRIMCTEQRFFYLSISKSFIETLENMLRFIWQSLTAMQIIRIFVH